MINDTTAGRWFRRIMWLGIFANLALALPTIAAPDMMIDLMRYPTATPALWPRFAGLLMVILSAFYTPAATDLDRYRIVAWFAIGSRAAGVAHAGSSASSGRPMSSVIGFQPGGWTMM